MVVWLNTNLNKVNASGVTLLDVAITANTVYTLSESIHNYNEIYIEASLGGSANKSSILIKTDQLTSYAGVDYEHGISFIDTNLVRFKFTSATSIRINDIAAYNHIKIVGYSKK